MEFLLEKLTSTGPNRLVFIQHEALPQEGLEVPEDTFKGSVSYIDPDLQSTPGKQAMVKWSEPVSMAKVLCNVGPW